MTLKNDSIASKKVKTSEFLIQCAATICISLLGFQTGFTYSWPSYTTVLFRSNETVLSMPMTSTHISLLGSLSNLGGLVISPFCSYAFNTFGRKYATVLFGLPFVFAWAIIALSSSIYLILLAMALAGIGIAGQNITTIFISEIVHDSIRGGLTACPASWFYLGLLVSNFIGNRLSYMQVVLIFLILSVLMMVSLLLLKESPVFLVLVGKEQEAAKSISFYKRLEYTSKEVEAEISKIKQQIDPKYLLQGAKDPETATEQLMRVKEPKVPARQSNEISSWNLLKKSKSSQRALIVITLLMALTTMMGLTTLQVYAEPIFMKAVPGLDSNQCAMIIGLVFLGSSLVCVLTMDRFGRQTLLIYTSVICGFCTAIIGTLLQFHYGPEWLIVLLIIVYCCSYTMGCSTTPCVLMSEMFLPEVRSFCSTLIMTSFWIVSFITLGMFTPLMEWVGLGPVFYIFAIFCFIVTIFSMFYIPETKGMSVIEIQKVLMNETQLTKT